MENDDVGNMDYVAEGKDAFEKAMSEEQEVWSEFMMSLRGGAEDNCKNLDWDEDLMPVLFVEGIFPLDMPGIEEEAKGKQSLLVVGLAGDFMKNSQTKDHLCDMMVMMCVKTKATGIALLHAVWMSILKPEKEGEKLDLSKVPTPSEDPNHIEKVMILSCQYGGPDDGVKTAFADIKREEGKPPQLTNWMISSEMAFEGRFHAAMTFGIDIAARIRAEEAKPQEGEEWKQS